MSKTPKRIRKRRPGLSAAEQQAEHTRRALKRSVDRARAITRLSKQLQRANDVAQRALLELAHDALERHGEDHIAEPANV